MFITTKELTTGERLRIARRRDGLTQAEAALAYGMPIRAYKRAEADEYHEWALTCPPIGKLELHEECFLLRRRQGLTLRELSRMIGLSIWWICQIEQGKAPVGTLRDYWCGVATA